jgi:hypothetical protein
MGKFLDMLPKAIQEKVKKKLVERNERKAEELENRASAYDLLGDNLYASIYYLKALKRTEHLHDRQREIRLLLRASVNQEKYAEELAQKAHLSSRKTKAWDIHDASEGFLAAAIITHRLGDPSFNPKLKRLVTKAKELLKGMPRENQYLTFVSYKDVTKVEKICGLRD